MGRVIISRRTTTRTLRTALDLVDRLNRGALLVLVLALVGLAYAVAPVLVVFFTAIVTVAKAAALLAGAAILARLAVKTAAEVTAPAAPTSPPTT
ncbi:hypothetical protein ACIPSE_45095 [Streptomyces sp. NPDC090106]|uniref:hypothetical protein n=1 Tax=Streptomyces sp. NPDC090106 TaxID=3365946 RepID=UPI0037F4B58C